jgi:hypothetical protein
MSWHFSRALVAAYSGASSLVGPRFARSRLRQPRAKSSWPDRTMVPSRRSRSGLTFAVSPHETTPCGQSSAHFAASAIRSSSREVSHVRTSVLPAEAKDWTVRGQACGITSGASLARYERATCSWKTHQRLLLEEGFESLEILPPWGMTVGGELYPLQTPSGLLEHRASITSVSGFGLSARVPAPTAGDGKSSGSRNLEGSKAHAGVSLTDFVKFGNSNTPRVPTPTRSDSKSPGETGCREGSDCLSVFVRRIPTPTVQDASNNGAPSQMERNTKPLNAEVGGPLNPQWVEWLMGWPVGWTDSHAPVTARCLTHWLWHGRS